MLKKYILLIVTIIPSILAYSQDDSNGPKKGDFMLSTTIGYNNYVGNKAVSGSSNAYGIAALSTDWFDAKTNIGIEGSCFFLPKYALRLGGGLGFTYNPGYTSVPGTFDENPDDDAAGNIPTYNAVAKGQTLKYNVFVGIDRYFGFSNAKNLYFNLGINGGFAYGLNQIKSDQESSMGKSIGEAYNIKGGINTGVSYFFLPAMYVGLEVNALQYTYNVTSIKPQEGLKTLSANSHNFSFLAAPTLKIGFKF